MRKTLALIFLILIASTLTTRASDCYLERNYYGARQKCPIALGNKSNKYTNGDMKRMM